MPMSPRLLRPLAGRAQVFLGGNLAANSLYDAALAMASGSPIAPAAGGTLTINGEALGSYDYAIRSGETLSSFTAADWFTNTQDTRSAWCVVRGSLTINPGVTFTPPVRKLFSVLVVTGDLTINGTVSMTARGANHSGTGNSGGATTARDIRIINGTYSGVLNPQIPAVGGAGGADTTSTTTGNPGGVSLNGGSGGGASGSFNSGGPQGTNGGSSGTSFSGGSGGASKAGGNPATPGLPNGGAGGGAGGPFSGSGGGAGNPGGVATGTGGVSGSDGTGGSLVIIVLGQLRGSGAVTANGSNGGASSNAGGGSGGGSVTIICGSDSSSIVPTATGGTGGGGGGNGTARKLLLPAIIDPQTISGLAGWWDAGDTQTLFQDSTGTTAVSALNHPVGRWSDKSGNGLHLLQATAGQRPLFRPADQNGRSVLRMTLTNNITMAASWNVQLNQGNTVFAVATTRFAPPLARFCPIIRWVTTNPNALQYESSSLSSPAASANRLESFVNAGGTFFRSVPTAAPVQGECMVLASVVSTSSIALFRNGLAWGDETPITGAIASTTSETLRLNSDASISGSTGDYDYAELLVYSRALTASERRSVESYLTAKWGVALLSPPTVSNADAQDWLNRVYNNGGTVSTSTAAAVNTFCDSIDAAGIRDRFYRLNLFCGNSDASLNAVRTPLYLSGSLGGAAIGNTIDANVNFAQGDYAETGGSGGLKGNGTTKYLNTGLTFASAPVATITMSAYAAEMETSAALNANFALLGSLNSASGFHGAALSTMWNFSAADRRMDIIGGSGTRVAAYSSGFVAAAHLSAGNTSGNEYKLYENGASRATTTGAVGTASNNQSGPVLVFCRNTSGSIASPTYYTAARIRAYHIGQLMTDAQQLAFYNAMHAFQTALGRQV